MIGIFGKLFKDNEEKTEVKTEEVTSQVKDLPEKLPNLRSLVGDYDSSALELIKKVYPLMSRYPASYSFHQSYPGGLWDHSIQVAEKMARMFKDSRESFIGFVVGLLHDIGKIGYFRIHTRYKYNPLSLKIPPDDLMVIGGTKDYPHEELSACMVFHFIHDVLDDLKPEELLVIVDAIKNHHTKVTGNKYLDALRDIDAEDTKEDVKDVVDQKPEEEKERQRVDLFRFRSVIRRMIQQGKLIVDYHFYVVDYEDTKLMLITSPKTFKDIVDQYNIEANTLLHENLFIEALRQEQWLAMLDRKENSPYVKTNLKIESKDRTLRFVIIFAEKVFNSGEIKQYMTRANKVSIKGYFIGKEVENSDEELQEED